jgi:hypothetical protein
LFDRVGLILIRYFVVLTNSVYRKSGHWLAESMDLAHSIMVLFLHSATPFCCGMWAMVSCCNIPAFLQYVINSWERNSPPQLDLRFRICFLVSFSTLVLNSLNSNRLPSFVLRSKPKIF